MSPPERRRRSRIKRRAKIQFESAGVLSKGVILNLSEDGMYVRSERMLPPGAILPIPIRLSKQIVTELHGKVVWSRHTLSEDDDQPHVGMGIMLSAAPEEYIKFVSNLRSQLSQYPRAIEERFEVYHQ